MIKGIVWRTGLLLILMSLIVFSLIGCGESADPDETISVDPSTDKYGGTFVVAKHLNPAHLDVDHSTDPTIGEIMYHIEEALFECDINYQPQPHLADSYVVSDDGLTYTIKLREGVLFHNGKEMTSEDVEASMQRWLVINGGGQRVAPYVESIEITGPYEIVVNLNTVYAPLISIMAAYTANQKLVIRPAELLAEYGEEIIREYIGTGPYKFVEWEPDQHVKLERFDEYVPNPNPGSRYYGERIAYLDEIIFRYVPEQAVRVAGIQTGEYLNIDQAPVDQFAMFEADPMVNALPIDARQELIVINSGAPPFNDVNVRKALNYAIDMEELASAMIGDPEFWSYEASYFPPGNIWNVPTGEGVYNVYDTEKAIQLLEESGYNGETVVILNGRDDMVESQGAIALQSMMEKVGFNVEVELYDRATVVERRSTIDGWNLHFTYFLQVYPDPQVYSAWMGTNGWITNWDDEDSRKMDEIFERMMVEVDYDERIKIVKEWNDFTWEMLPYIKTVNWKLLRLNHVSVQDMVAADHILLWNVWLD